MITKFKLYESVSEENDNINYLLKLPLDVRKTLKKYLEKHIKEVANESVFSEMQFKLKSYIKDKVLLWLLNQSEKRLEKQIDLLNLFDPTDFSNIKKCEVIYLGGGIDKTPDEYMVHLPKTYGAGLGIGVRLGLLQKIIDKINNEYPDKLKEIQESRFVFVVERGTDLRSILTPEEFNSIELIAGGGAWRFQIEKLFGEEHTVIEEDLLKSERTGRMDISKYPKPLIINPLRKEQSVRDDDEFHKVYAKWKRGELDKTKDDSEFKYMAKIINRDIKPPDLRLLNICDSNLVKYDAVAGDGTKGELQFGALKHLMNVFLWLDGGYDVKDISPWTFPEATKIVRNEEELHLLIESIKLFNNA